MAKSKTKAYTKVKWLLRAASLARNVGPLAGYAIAGAATSTLAREKLMLSLTVIVVLIMTVVSVVNKIAMRSRIWVVMIGIYVCLGEILVPLMVIAATQLLDELIVSPLAKHYASRELISKEIDRRI